MSSSITPALNAQIVKRAEEIAKEKGFEGSKKLFDKAFNMAIKEFGYSPAYYNKVMRSIGADDGDEWHPGMLD